MCPRWERELCGRTMSPCELQKQELCPVHPLSTGLPCILRTGLDGWLFSSFLLLFFFGCWWIDIDGDTILQLTYFPKLWFKTVVLGAWCLSSDPLEGTTRRYQQEVEKAHPHTHLYWSIYFPVLFLHDSFKFFNYLKLINSCGPGDWMYGEMSDILVLLDFFCLFVRYRISLHCLGSPWICNPPASATRVDATGVYYCAQLNMMILKSWTVPSCSSPG